MLPFGAFVIGVTAGLPGAEATCSGAGAGTEACAENEHLNLLQLQKEHGDSSVAEEKKERGDSHGDWPNGKDGEGASGEQVQVIGRSASDWSRCKGWRGTHPKEGLPRGYCCKG